MVRRKCRCCTHAVGRAICSALSKVKADQKLLPRRLRLVAAKSKRKASDTMFSSVRARLTFWYAGVLACTLLLLSLVIYFIVKRSVTERTDAGLVELANSFLSTLDAELSDATPANDIAAAARQSMLEHQYPGHSFAVLSSSGEMLATSSELAAAIRESRQEPAPRLSSDVLQTCLSKATGERGFATIPGRRGGMRCYARSFTVKKVECRLVILASRRPQSELFARLRV